MVKQMMCLRLLPFLNQIKMLFILVNSSSNLFSSVHSDIAIRYNWIFCPISPQEKGCFPIPGFFVFKIFLKINVLNFNLLKLIGVQYKSWVVLNQSVHNCSTRRSDEFDRNCESFERNSAGCQNIPTSQFSIDFLFSVFLLTYSINSF